MQYQVEKLINYKLSFYVPETHLEEVKQAVFAAGAGRQGDYEHCCWQCLGQGQFKPLPGANPMIGTVDALTFVPEYKVEILCTADCIESVVQALKSSHPYEEPAYEVVRLERY
ncbi:NGG1p interacting factor NIF3 [Legionella jamestowniensis]|uniref:NGG1p interacting factor NIF3 n=1 Tax=Legionella jamestowniensis TaxID=455 RepID=A0A0W0UJT7_9GAMM|nr:structural toxin protein (hemagglutinin/hemolysin) RtxA [Legionella jamestowniensis]OCH98475.1 NGG1p interacting factor NIF3 [Legionella jamestowniensis]SFL99290.1 structural toxin protein (hemagglutinin/hemolysin) RtxA [Legionella jamestowniensis DSM 19215]